MALHDSKKVTLADWEALGDEIRAELIDGVIYAMAGPSALHQRVSSFLHSRFYSYLDGKPCEVFAAPYDVYLQNETEDTPNIVQPDLLVICDRDKVTDRGCHGAPDFIIEIVSPGTSRRDYLTKLNLYAEYGVKEYWIVNPKDETVAVYVFSTDVTLNAYTFQDSIKVRTLEELTVDFSQLRLP